MPTHHVTTTQDQQPTKLRSRPKLSPLNYESTIKYQTSRLRIQAAQTVLYQLSNNIGSQDDQRDDLADTTLAWVGAAQRAGSISRQDPQYPAALSACALLEREVGQLLRAKVNAVYLRTLPDHLRRDA